MSQPSPKAVQLYRAMDCLPEFANQADFSVEKSSKILPRGLLRVLQKYRDQNCIEGLKDSIENTIIAVEDMIPGGKHQLFKFAYGKNKRMIQYVGLAARKYIDVDSRHEVFDYCICTYTFDKSYTEMIKLTYEEVENLKTVPAYPEDIAYMSIKDTDDLYNVPEKPDLTTAALFGWIPIIGTIYFFKTLDERARIDRLEAENEQIRAKNKRIEQENMSAAKENERREAEYERKKLMHNRAIKENMRIEEKKRINERRREQNAQIDEVNKKNYDDSLVPITKEQQYVLEACFLFELVERGLAKLQDGEFRLKPIGFN